MGAGLRTSSPRDIQAMHATIVNRLDQAVGIVTETFARYIPPKTTDSEIPIEAARAFKSTRDAQVWIKAGKVRVLIPKDSATDETEEEIAVDSGPDVNSVEVFKALHWKTAVSKVDVITDLDFLEELFAAEDRARVVSSIEKRIRLLTDDKTEIEI